MIPAVISIAGSFAAVLGVFLSNGYALLTGLVLVAASVAWCVAGIVRDWWRDLAAERSAELELSRLRRK